MFSSPAASHAESQRRAAHYFSQTYAEARQRFLAAATAGACSVASFPLCAAGSQGEALATDVALLACPGADRVLLITSATHGAEGFCGSACQLALLDDADLLARMAAARVALLLVHAINPYGFSWSSRTDASNVDLNRNALPFGAPLPDNHAYAELHPLLLPPIWPPDADNRQAMARYIARHGPQGYRDAVSRGQYTHPEGLFYGGTEPRPSLRTLEHILRQHASGFADIAWIDVHTGLGPRGHGEKIYAGRRNMADVARAQHWWGLDVTVPFSGSSKSADVTGHLTSMAYAACPDARITPMALEFGTVPFVAMVDALRGEAWLRAHPDAPCALASRIRRDLRDAFYCDALDWKAMVLGQSRVAILQALGGLAAEAGAHDLAPLHH